MKNEVWLVTGTSKGFGLSLVKKLIEQGYKVAATSRNIAALKDVVKVNTANFLPLEVDLISELSIAEAVAKTVATFGELNVVVNNAGYGIGGTIEELSTSEIQQSFGINVFAPITVMQKVLPIFRKQKSGGYIINISSIAGFNATAGWAMYAATKFALTGMTEVLAMDLEGMGIYTTVVAPGAFRTAFLSSDSLVLSENKIEDYTAVRASHEKYATMDGKQLGNPDKAADVFIDLSKMEVPPVRLFMGTDSYNRAKNKISILTEELENLKHISEKTDY
ncbi:short-chain dehydrogenase/reductase [Neptunitalea chrysea]|uniref:Short-chain dehydrogenase/reductase n=1 Tax=Neptunitalea chrysea TaxID=1647581 RepID=A0A9W6ETD7_9FLAO|nr:SDR family oxidoreductase [Neptunitalea chrysea]GLB51800.1 short-chain dehydrogenase/reductase [Neptunitalea chrysea]